MLLLVYNEQNVISKANNQAKNLLLTKKFTRCSLPMN